MGNVAFPNAGKNRSLRENYQSCLLALALISLYDVSESFILYTISTTSSPDDNFAWIRKRSQEIWTSQVIVTSTFSLLARMSPMTLVNENVGGSAPHPLSQEGSREMFVHKTNDD